MKGEGANRFTFETRRHEFSCRNDSRGFKLQTKKTLEAIASRVFLKIPFKSIPQAS